MSETEETKGTNEVTETIVKVAVPGWARGLGGAAIIAVGLFILVLVSSSFFRLSEGDRQRDEAAALHRKVADSFFATAQYRQALVGYTRAHDIAPTREIEVAMARTRLFLIASEPEAVAQVPTNDIRFDLELLAADPDNAATYRTVEGHLALSKGHADDAKTAYDLALAQDPKNVGAHLGRAMILRRSDPAKAYDEYAAAALAPAPLSFLGQMGRGETALQMQDAAKALDAFQEAAKLREDSGPAHRGLGSALIAAKRNQDAFAEFQKAIALDPKDADSLASMGNLLMGANQPAEAEKALRAALAIRPDPQMTVSLAGVLTRNAKPTEALQLLEPFFRQGNPPVQIVIAAARAADMAGSAPQATSLYGSVLRTIQDPQARLDPETTRALQAEAQGAIDRLSRAPVGIGGATPATGPSAGPGTR